MTPFYTRLTIGPFRLFISFYLRAQWHTSRYLESFTIIFRWYHLWDILMHWFITLCLVCWIRYFRKFGNSKITPTASSCSSSLEEISTITDGIECYGDNLYSNIFTALFFETTTPNKSHLVGMVHHFTTSRWWWWTLCNKVHRLRFNKKSKMQSSI